MSKRRSVYDVAVDAFKYGMGAEAGKHLSDWNFRQSEQGGKLFTFDSEGMLRGEITVSNVRSGTVTIRTWQLDCGGGWDQELLLLERTTTIKNLRKLAEDYRMAPTKPRQYTPVTRNTEVNITDNAHRAIRNRISELVLIGGLGLDKARRQALREHGRCPVCARDVRDDAHTLCSTCRAMSRIYAQWQAEARRAQGKCTSCGRKLPDGYTHKTCEACMEKARQAYYKAKQRKEATT